MNLFIAKGVKAFFSIMLQKITGGSMCHSDWKCTLREETCVYKQLDTQKNDCAFLPDGLRLPVVMIYDCCLATITKKIHVVVSKKQRKKEKNNNLSA